MITIYHNNRCGKSRSALCILEETGKLFRTVEYLKDVPSVEELKSIIKKLQLNWSEKELRNYLKGKKEVETINKKPLQYTIVDATKRQKTLFD